VDKVIGSGNSNDLKTYSIVDKNKVDGTLYYRLSQTDFDGKSKYFGPVAVSCADASENISFYPNPFSSTIKVKIKDVSLSNAMIYVYNTLGVVVYSQRISCDNLNPCEIDLRDLQNGLYTIELKSDFLSIIEKIIKK